VPGVLTWSFEDGARLELIGDANSWPRARSAQFVVHGELRDGGDVSLLYTWVRRVALGDQVTALHASTLALGGHITDETRWPRVGYSTANLSEWRCDTGLDHPEPPQDIHVRIDWKPPSRDEVELPDARLVFRGCACFATTSADWSVGTWQQMDVAPVQPVTLGESWRRFANPLLNLLSLASDRPDGVVLEKLVHPDERRVVEVWRQGQTVRPREWRLGSDHLFQAADLNDFAGAIRRWWALDEQLRPALGLFADHINQGRSYSSGRFLALFTAMEVYRRERHNNKKLPAMQEYAGVSTDATGCTKEAIALIGATRTYLAHLSAPRNSPPPDEIEDNILLSTRRLSALMQACLMRDLDFSASEIEKKLSGHHGRWPLS
jgi:hypothetical protein